MLSLKKAKEVIVAAEEKAGQLGIAVSIAIVDQYGVLVAFSRMDNALPISAEFSFTKAYTAASFGMATADLSPYTVEGKPYYGLNSLFGGRLTTVAGGIPITQDGKLVGGIGIGGSADVSQDVACAMAALMVMGK